MSAAARKYFTPREVSFHNSENDLWVSFLGKVYDLTSLCQSEKGNVLMKPIMDAGGTDISHWFNAKTHDVLTYVDPDTNCVIPYCPNGRYLHIPPPYPDSQWVNNFGCPWWKNNSYIIGNLSQKTRFIKIVNTLTSQEHIIEVCTEERLNAILERYLMYNAHAASYTWKYDKRNLNMNQTLDENGIRDEDEDFYLLRMKDNEFLQTIHLYFNDDLTEK